LLATTITIPGPFYFKYTLVNEKLSKDFVLGDKAYETKDRDPACIMATMESYHFTEGRAILRTATYFRMKVIEPRLVPWPEGGNMMTTNKHILTKDHWMVQHCFDCIWVSTSAETSTPKGL
jgi:hypothetical protein